MRKATLHFPPFGGFGAGAAPLSRLIKAGGRPSFATDNHPTESKHDLIPLNHLLLPILWGPGCVWYWFAPTSELESELNTYRARRPESVAAGRSSDEQTVEGASARHVFKASSKPGKKNRKNHPLVFFQETGDASVCTTATATATAIAIAIAIAIGTPIAIATAVQGAGWRSHG